MEKKRIFDDRNKIRKFMVLFAFCISAVINSGCSMGKGDGNKAQDDGKQAAQQTETADVREDKTAEQDEDMVSSPIDFGKLDTVDKVEESGISYYNFHSTKEMPLPLNEWAKLDIATERDAVVPAYIQFTSFTRDVEEIEKHMRQYFKANNIESTFNASPELAGDEYVLMKYDILIGKPLKKGDAVSTLSVRFPLQLYSTMKSGNFGDDTVQERENFVRDVSISDTDVSLAVGTAMEKAVLCSVPKDYKAYGIMIPYLNAEGTTQTLCFKLEY